MSKVYFAGQANGCYYFRASNGRFAFKSLTFNDQGRWIGFSGKAGKHEVREVSKAFFDILLAGKHRRIAAEVADYTQKWEQECIAAEAAGKPKPHKYGTGFGSAPDSSWVDADDVADEIRAHIFRDKGVAA